MEKQVIYGVYAIEVELPEKSDRVQEVKNIADAMINFNGDGKFVRAYAKLADAVTDCMDGNGWLLARTMESPDGVKNGKSTSFYFPKTIEVIK